MFAFFCQTFQFHEIEQEIRAASAFLHFWYQFYQLGNEIRNHVTEQTNYSYLLSVKMDYVYSTMNEIFRGFEYQRKKWFHVVFMYSFLRMLQSKMLLKIIRKKKIILRKFLKCLYISCSSKIYVYIISRRIPHSFRTSFSDAQFFDCYLYQLFS